MKDSGEGFVAPRSPNRDLGHPASPIIVLAILGLREQANAIIQRGLHANLRIGNEKRRRIHQPFE
jgi:hypothetical protein